MLQQATLNTFAMEKKQKALVRNRRYILKIIRILELKNKVTETN